jgi:predicted permease
LVELFADNLLPVFLAAGAGYALSAALRVDPRPVAHLGFYVLAPCLIFQVIVGSELPGGDVIRMIGFAAAVLLVPALAAGLLARRLRWPRTLVAAVVLVVLLPNAANFGLAVNLFAFGERGFAQASLFFLSSAVLTYTLGVFVASLGRTNLGNALIGLVRVPAIWAVLGAVLVVRAGIDLPSPVTRTVEMLSAACIPVFLVVLGMQLHGRGIKGPIVPVTFAVGMRLIGGSAAALVLAWAFGLEGAARQAGVLQASMPSAVICIVLATEYDVEPAFVTSVVFLTTLLSPLTLTPLLAYLGA